MLTNIINTLTGTSNTNMRATYHAIVALKRQLLKTIIIHKQHEQIDTFTDKQELGAQPYG